MGAGRRPRALLGLLVPAWLWAASGAAAQVFSLRLAVDEGLPPGTLVGDLRAGLPAAQQRDAPGFLLSEDAADSPLLGDFHVHPDTGVIRTARRLDRERRDRYSFAAATPRGAVVQVEIRVNDVNDHAPCFPRDALRLEVSELSPPGTAFRLPAARDPDAGLFSTQGYSLVRAPAAPRDPAGPLFELRYGDPEPLELVLLRRLDREAAAAHELQIQAWDGGSPRRTGRLRVELRVLDENDNPPVFERAEYRAAVREDAPPGAEVCRVRATDRDLGPNGLVRYGLRARQADAAYFAVEEWSGAVRVRRPLDREVRAWHQLVVEARDGGAEPEVASARVSIAVLDVNDNPPAIHLLYLTEGGAARVSEGARPGDYVARVSVSDADGDLEKEEAAAGEPGGGLGGGDVSLALEGAEGAFALRPGGPPGVFFLCVEGALDRESRDLYQLRLVATDAGAPPLSTEETLLLRVADLNDQAPVFSQERYGASVSEAAAPGTAVLRVSASDADEPGTDGARLRYALVQPSARCSPEGSPPAGECGPAFTIDPDMGVISTRRALDREAQEAVELRVEARDLGEPPRSATCLVRVTVEDVNDNEPVFRRQVYNATLEEHAPVGHCFLQVTASDADAGLYGLVEYSLYHAFQSEEAPAAFRIDPRDGQICVTQDIDRERDAATFDLLVKAQDGGGLSAQAFVRVDLEDVNDNRPVFDPSTYVTSISGQTQPGTEVISVLARDRDSGTFGRVTYKLFPGDLSSLFTIDSTTGVIYLTSTLSHLEPTTLFLMVSAQDGGGLTATINADVTIHVLQTELAPAEFERPKYTFSVYEDVPEGSLVGTVKARESLNASAPVSYRISSGDPDGRFRIHPWLGAIRTRGPLDHETQPAVLLTVQARLGGAAAGGGAEVHIAVLDVNDHRPEFPAAAAEITVPASTPPGAALYLARARDADSGHNGRVRYALAGPAPQAFALDGALGLLTLRGRLAPDGPQRLALTLVAEDLGAPPRASRLELTVVVERRPWRAGLAFESLVYQADAREGLPPATRLLRAQARALGLPRLGAGVRYSLEACAEAAAFGVHPRTGWIHLRRPLDYEAARAHSFRVLAWLPGDPGSGRASASVTVRVLDENDNAPAFPQDALFLKVLEGPGPLGVVARVTAADPDSAENGQLSYFLLSDGKFFRMNPHTGELISWLALDREQQGHHRMTVLVTDHGSPPRNATLPVYVTVTDVNDNKPFFPQCLPGKEFHIKVLEGQPVNALVTTVFAKDLDEGDNAVITYAVSAEDYPGHFKIDANNGEIRTTVVLSHDHRPSYRLTVIASDRGTPPLHGEAIVNIQVIPLSKGRAFVSPNIRHLVVPENLKPAKIMSLIKSPGRLQQLQHGRLRFSIAPEDRDAPFDIDSSTGDLILSGQLDYEMTSHFLLRVIHQDLSQDPAMVGMVFLSIAVEDQNDHSPAFRDESLVVSVAENVPVGTRVCTFDAKDGDGGFLNSRIQYSVESHHAGANPFLIHPSSGTLVTASPLDRERVPAVTLTVTASDQAVNVTDRRWRSLVAEVVILDVNDHSPDFVSSPRAYVREDAAVGSPVHHVRAQDPDEGRNGKVSYSILSGNENMAFALDQLSGVLTVAGPLDHELSPQHVLTLLAQDGGTPALSSSQTVTITVLDVNDEAPVFEQHLYEVSVKENRSPGEFVTRVEAKDRDSGINAKLQFEIMPGASFGFFKINADTGELVTTTVLDREAQEVFTLRVLVHDGGLPSLSSSATILCTVEDDNDNAPTLLFPSHDIEILENQEPQVVYTVLAFDMDAGNNGAVEYHIINGNTDEYFALHETSGELSTTRALDRERVSTFTLVILASDLGDPPRSSVMRLQVRVLDDNDHSPSFPVPSYQSSVREDAEMGTVVLQLSAVDADEGLNGRMEYFLLGESLGAFTVDPVTGALRTHLALDREARPQHTFRAGARDCGVHSSRSATVTVEVSVTDVNDNGPVWEQNPVDVFLSPTSPAHETIAVVRAGDPDAGPNGTVLFSFVDVQSMFSVDKDTGEIKLRQNLALDGFPIWLQLQVSDQGVPARTATGLLVIHGEGEQAAISFSHHLYKGLVTEHCEPGTSILTVKAFASNSTQDTIKYSIFSGNEDGVFSLGSETGHLTVREPQCLDFEVRSEVQLVVLAESSGHKAYSRVAVSIQDVNDNFPRFQHSAYQASVPEGRLCDTPIIQVLATDLDSGVNSLVEYSILSGNQAEAFRIDPLSGVITANGVLDYESTSSYSLTVQATDRGVPRLSDTTVIKIQVTDINDNAPAFLPSEAVEIAENSLPGVIVSRVSVHDADSNPAFIFGFAEESNPGRKFAIDRNTGAVVLVRLLDFEDAAEYELIIHVSDSVHRAEGSLVVRVLDVNDNPPVFAQGFYQATLPESVPLGYSVLSVSATDLESNGNISYRILSSSKEFSIDPVNGTIFTTSPGQFLDNTSAVQFLVEASDGGMPALRAVTLVEIEIQDTNNHAPAFTVECYNLSLREDAPVGSTLVTFSTTDQDWTLENTHVEYSIISGNAQNSFHVETHFIHSEYPHEQVGSLVLLHSLDREACASHQLVILASDRGCPPLSSTAVVSIQVLDINDNPPRFSRPEYHAHVRESMPVGDHITVVSADDRDVGPHAEVTYRIISGNEKERFHLEENTGVLYLVKPLDYEEMTKFALTVRAADKEQELFSFAVVLVTVLDDNDHAPQFLSSTLNCVAPENLPASSTVCSVSAWDFDEGPYGEVTYSISSPCSVAHGARPDQDLFTIDPLTGDIHTRQTLDYESVSEYCLVVQAKDRGGSTASMTVWVDVEGVDEFEPVFTQDRYFFNIEKSQGRQVVGTVDASDADAGTDGVVLYSLGTPSPFFSVNKTNGDIYWIPAPPLVNSQIGKEDTMEVKIIARSPRPGSRFTSCSVFVNVSRSSEGNLPAVGADGFSVSLMVSVVVFLLLICVLTVLISRHKQKGTPHSYEAKADTSVTLPGDASMLKGFQETKAGGDQPGPGLAAPEWLSLISTVERDIIHLYGHSDSSGRCSVEGETAEDKEIRRINERPHRKDAGSVLSDRGSRVPDSGIPRDSDQLSCLSGETDVMVSAEAAEASCAFEGGDGREGTICVQNNALPQKREAKEGLVANVRKEAVAGDQETRYAALSTRLPCDHLLNWEPKFQSLASVFSDIAKLKDECLQMPGAAKEKSSVLPPPLLTAVARPGIKAVPSRLPAGAPGPAVQKQPRSPILSCGHFLPEAMTPSFSPSLSPLTTQTPARAPVLSEGV